ncbi:MAG: hypothetical protein LBU32_15870 [Clostridiales bacterium]|nr:hypothetical protein [Clostridiales bacterium]
MRAGRGAARRILKAGNPVLARHLRDHHKSLICAALHGVRRERGICEW